MKTYIGIDLGGTKINGGLFNEYGEILDRKTIDIRNIATRDLVLDNIVSIIDILKKDNTKAVGIGSPGSIDSQRGLVLDIGGNLPNWANTDIKGHLEKKFDLEIFVDNDGNIAALCESFLGAGQNYKDFVMITIGTGLGGGIYLDKKIFPGSFYEGGELGHMILYPRGRTCNCGQRGCVEKYISGTSIEKSYFDKTGLVKKGEDIFKLYGKDQIASEIIDDFSTDLSIFLLSLKNILDPQAIIIGGGVINSSEYWWDNMLLKFKESLNTSSKIEILPAKYLNDAGMIGAARLAMIKG